MTFVLGADYKCAYLLTYLLTSASRCGNWYTHLYNVDWRHLAKTLLNQQADLILTFCLPYCLTGRVGGDRQNVVRSVGVCETRGGLLCVVGGYAFDEKLATFVTIMAYLAR